jgi:hypothetical protein
VETRINFLAAYNFTLGGEGRTGRQMFREISPGPGIKPY